VVRERFDILAYFPGAEALDELVRADRTSTDGTGDRADQRDATVHGRVREQVADPDGTAVRDMADRVGIALRDAEPVGELPAVCDVEHYGAAGHAASPAAPFREVEGPDRRVGVRGVASVRERDARVFGHDPPLPVHGAKL